MREYVDSPIDDASSRVVGGTPVTRHQRVLCQLVADVLGVSGVGIGDGFVALGGDSIIAINSSAGHGKPVFGSPSETC
nr:phosphopantetheine-binding protein [Streptomyces sp. SID7834]